eukprot:gene3481-3979_t
MFSRLKNVIKRIRGRKNNEDSQVEYDVSYQPEDDAFRQKLLEYRDKVTDFLEPVKNNWLFVEETLLWKNHFLSCVCFFVISGIFWKFISMKFKKTALIIGAFLLANAISGDIRTNCWDFFHKNLHLEVKEPERLPFNFDELCLDIAIGCLLCYQSVTFIRDLKDHSPSKFYCLLAVLLFSTLMLLTYFPVVDFLYVLVCGLFFYPSLNHYGIMDRLEARINIFVEPIKKHWENNRTKRMRNLQGKFTQQTEFPDISDDEFLLEGNAFKNTVLSSVAPDKNNEMTNDDINHDVIKNRMGNFHDGDTEDEEEEFDESQFANGLALPSMSNFDSMMEPYDEFHTGLRFPDVNDEESQVAFDNERILNAAANNLDTDEEDIDDLPYDNDVDGDKKPQGRHSGPLYQPSTTNELRHRPHSQEMKASKRDLPSCSLTASEIEDSMRAVETDFEFLDHDDLYDMDAYIAPVITATTSPPSDSNPNNLPSQTITQTGLATVSKWLGYE